MEIVGAAAAKLVLAKHPFLLRFGHNDIHGRLRKGDFVLISQTRSDHAEIHVVLLRGLLETQSVRHLRLLLRSGELDEMDRAALDRAV